VETDCIIFQHGESCVSEKITVPCPSPKQHCSKFWKPVTSRIHRLDLEDPKQSGREFSFRIRPCKMVNYNLLYSNLISYFQINIAFLMTCPEFHREGSTKKCIKTFHPFCVFR
jgi:hypothetical protein